MVKSFSLALSSLFLAVVFGCGGTASNTVSEPAEVAPTAEELAEANRLERLESQKAMEQRRADEAANR